MRLKQKKLKNHKYLGSWFKLKNHKKPNGSLKFMALGSRGKIIKIQLKIFRLIFFLVVGHYSKI